MKDKPKFKEFFDDKIFHREYVVRVLYDSHSQELRFQKRKDAEKSYTELTNVSQKVIDAQLTKVSVLRDFRKEPLPPEQFKLERESRFFPDEI